MVSPLNFRGEVTHPAAFRGLRVTKMREVDEVGAVADLRGHALSKRGH